MSETTKKNKKFLEDEKEISKKKADTIYKKTHSDYAKKTELGWAPGEEPPGEFINTYNKNSANTKDSVPGTISDLAHRKGSKVMDAAGIFDMEEDLDKQKKEDERKKGARFSGLKKLLRGE